MPCRHFVTTFFSEMVAARIFKGPSLRCTFAKRTQATCSPNTNTPGCHRAVTRAVTVLTQHTNPFFRVNRDEGHGEEMHGIQTLSQ